MTNAMSASTRGWSIDSRMGARCIVSISGRGLLSMATLSIPLRVSRWESIRPYGTAPAIPTRVLIVVVIPDSCRVAHHRAARAGVDDLATGAEHTAQQPQIG